MAGNSTAVVRLLKRTLIHNWFFFLFLFSEIAAAFKVFDKDGDGHITVAELGETMKTVGQELSETELEEIIQAVDRNGM